MKFWGVRLVSLLVAVGGCFLLDFIMTRSFGSYPQRLVILAGLYVTLSVSLNLINGITGQFSIGHAAFYQVGAYLAGFLSVRFFASAHIPGLWWLIGMMGVGALGAAIAGLIVGLPSLRLRGDYLAIVTLGFGEIIRIVVQNTEEVGGAYGFNVQPKFAHIWLVWLLAVVCIAVCRNLLKTAHGLPFLAVREDEVAALAMGVNNTRVKVTAFLLGSAFAGAAGALLAHFEGFITPATFAMDVSFIILTMVVLGGTGSITGSAVAAAFLSFLPEYLRTLKNPDGTPLTVTGGGVLSALIGVVVAVAIIKWTVDHYHGKTGTKLLIYLGALIAGVIAKLALTPAIDKVPTFAKAIEAGQLRMVIFAVTLIVVMLLRPQGIFGHHEFSWSWLAKLFGKKAPEKAVAA